MQWGGGREKKNQLYCVSLAGSGTTGEAGTSATIMTVYFALTDFLACFRALSEGLQDWQPLRLRVLISLSWAKKRFSM